MKKSLIVASLVTLSSVIFAQEIPQEELDYARRNQEAELLKSVKKTIPAVELETRNGLGNFFDKAARGEDVTIVYFGGSITAHDGWRPQSFEYLKSLYPNTKMKMVNASMGGTGSIFGVFRADNDLVKHNPDLVFIEFAVNDGGDAQRRTKDVMRAVEGIIRKVKTANPKADICLVYTVQEPNFKDLDKGNAQAAVVVHEEVAKHYDLPSIYFGPAINKLIKDGKVVAVGKVVDKASGTDANGKIVFTDDKTHPVNPTGHALYTEVIKRVIPVLQQVKSEEKPLASPIFSNSWENAKTLDLDNNVTFKGTWSKEKARAPHYRTSEAGASVTIKFKGSMVGFTDFVGPESGKVIIQIDDQKPTEDNRFSVYGNNWRTSGGPLPELKEGEHTVTWTLSNEKFDKGKILASYYRADNDKPYRDNPEKYAAYTFNPIKIMIVGDIVKE